MHITGAHTIKPVLTPCHPLPSGEGATGLTSSVPSSWHHRWCRGNRAPPEVGAGGATELDERTEWSTGAVGAISHAATLVLRGVADALDSGLRPMQGPRVVPAPFPEGNLGPVFRDAHPEDVLARDGPLHRIPTGADANEMQHCPLRVLAVCHVLTVRGLFVPFIAGTHDEAEAAGELNDPAGDPCNDLIPQRGVRKRIPGVRSGSGGGVVGAMAESGGVRRTDGIAGDLTPAN